MPAGAAMATRRAHPLHPASSISNAQRAHNAALAAPATALIRRRVIYQSVEASVAKQPQTLSFQKATALGLCASSRNFIIA